jgi:hypothetical protein
MSSTRARPQETRWRLHQAEQWRDRLIADDAARRVDHAVPGTDMQQLRALIRQARKDAQPDKTSRRRAWRRATAAPTASFSSWCASRWRCKPSAEDADSRPADEE